MHLVLNWTDNSDNESGFRIYRGTSANGTFSEVATVGAGVTTYTNRNLANDTRFYYRVVAYNADGESGHTSSNAKSYDWPWVESLTPNTGGFVIGPQHTFTTVISDGDGADNISAVYMYIMNTVSLDGGLLVVYSHRNGTFSIVKEDGSRLTANAGSNAVLGDSETFGTLDCSGPVTVSDDDGNSNDANEQLTINWKITFKSNYPTSVPKFFVEAVDRLNYRHMPNFGPIQLTDYELTVPPSTNGTVTVDWTGRTTCTLTATPDPGYVFVRWTGDTDIINPPGTATDPVVNVTLNGNKTITAEFAREGLFFAYSRINAYGQQGFDVKLDDILPGNSYQDFNFRTGGRFKLWVDCRIMATHGVSTGYGDPTFSGDTNSSISMAAITPWAHDIEGPASAFETNTVDSADIAGITADPLDLSGESGDVWLFKYEQRDKYRVYNVHTHRSEGAGTILTSAPTFSGWPYAADRWRNTYGNGGYLYVDGDGELHLKYVVGVTSRHGYYCTGRLTFLIGIQRE